MSHSAALITGSHPHLIDHLAPLCDLLNMPLICTEENEVNLCKTFYPDINVQHVSYRECTLVYLSKYENLFSSTFWKKEQKILFQFMTNKIPKLFFVPHGNSDKGHIKPLLEPYIFQDHVFLYGDQMIDHLKKRNLFSALKESSRIGNYRLAYYLAKKSFFDKVVDKQIFSKLNTNNKTLIYCPTWNDYEDLSSYSLACQKLIDQLPKGYNLLIKPHPLIKRRSIEQWVVTDFDKENVFLLDDIPLIYPIMNRVDGYIGDFSSVGYDFLYTEKPMFFIDKGIEELKHSNLFDCGYKLPIEKAFSVIDQHIDHWSEQKRAKQKEVFSYAFGKNRNLCEIKKDLVNVIKRAKVKQR